MIWIPQHKLAKPRGICILLKITCFLCAEDVSCRFCVADRFSFSIKISTTKEDSNSLVQHFQVITIKGHAFLIIAFIVGEYVLKTRDGRELRKT